MSRSNPRFHRQDIHYTGTTANEGSQVLTLGVVNDSWADIDTKVLEDIEIEWIFFQKD